MRLQSTAKPYDVENLIQFNNNPMTDLETAQKVLDSAMNDLVQRADSSTLLSSAGKTKRPFS